MATRPGSVRLLFDLDDAAGADLGGPPSRWRREAFVHGEGGEGDLNLSVVAGMHISTHWAAVWR